MYGRFFFFFFITVYFFRVHFSRDDITNILNFVFKCLHDSNLYKFALGDEDGVWWKVCKQSMKENIEGTALVFSSQFDSASLDVKAKDFCIHLWLKCISMKRQYKLLTEVSTLVLKQKRSFRVCT